jgi:DNA-binding GntR family transcriptional regulator
MGKLDHYTLTQRIYYRLREMIESGSLQPGSKLDEQALADRMSVSRTPLREALGKLAREGIIENRPYRGNFVRTFTAKQVNDLYEVRRALEGLAVRLAVPKLSGEYLRLLRSILDDIQEALERGDMAGYGAADQRFHDTLAQLAGNETLIESIERLRLQIQLVKSIANQDPNVVERTARERPQILAALESRDAELAARLMEEHIEGVRRAVVSQFEALENTSDKRQAV